MDDNVADGLLPDLRGLDISSLLADDADSSMESALDRILLCGVGIYNDFGNCIG